MIVYYQISTGKILAILSHKSKAHLKKQKDLEKELDSMFDDMVGDVGVSRFKPDVDATCGGTWDPNTNTMTSPPSKPNIPPHPHKARLKELKDKWAADPSKATTTELAEYLAKADLTKHITEDVALGP